MNLKSLVPRNIRYKVMDILKPLPDIPYVRLFYFTTTGRHLNLKHPELFSEKQQWLKFNDIHPEYSRLADKLTVKEYVDSCIGPGHCFPLIGKWKTFEEIDFSQLPESFVLKCNHDSGSTKVIRSKSKLTEKDKEKLKKHFNHRVKSDFYYVGREYPYKGLNPYIIAEEMMVDEKTPHKSIEDYKFFCFNGEPRLMFVATDRGTDLRFDFFDMDFNWLNIQNIHPNASKKIEKPAMFEELKETAAKLSQGMKFVRVDLYEINGKIYFGEYTFFHGGGFCLFYPMEWEKKMGEWIDLNVSHQHVGGVESSLPQYIVFVIGEQKLCGESSWRAAA